MNEKLKKQLEKLAHGNKGRTLIARLNDHFTEVETALQNGVSVADVVATLAQNGLVLSENTFKVYMSRLRSRRKKSETASSPTLLSSAEKKADESPVPKPVPQPKAKRKTPTAKTVNEAITDAMNAKPDINELRKIAKANRSKSK